MSGVPMGEYGRHVPVMLAEVLAGLAVRDDAIYVDGTFGAGGYSRRILKAANCQVIGIDRDPDAVAEATPDLAAHDGRLSVHHGRFGDMDAIVAQVCAGTGRDSVDGVTLDLGVSSMQLDRGERGFSFRSDGPLDMRMEQAGPSASELVNEADEAELADIIYRYGEERQSRRVARAIVNARRDARIETTGALAAIVRRAVGYHAERDRIDPATRTFQGLRIAVNDELAELERGLEAAERVLAPGGRLAVVAFHSLEDRPVKAFLRARSGERPSVSRHLPDTAPGERPTFRLIERRALRPSEAEIAANPRARTARLRVAERTDAPASSSLTAGSAA